MHAYTSMLEKLQSGASHESVEAAFEAALAVRRALLQKKSDDDTLLESFSAAEFEAVTKALRGIIVNREEVLIVQPDPAFFRSLAEKYGGPADVEFFRNYAATLPDGVWQSYIQQQTDFTGCTAFGDGELIKRYSGWLAFRSAYPRTYPAQVAEQIAAIEAELTESTCACGSRHEVMRELEQFANTFPKSAVIKKVQKRIRELRQSTSRIRFRCVSG